jgi:hypothetical protein
LKSSDYEVETLNDSNSLEEWDNFVDESPQGSIFCRSWWLRAVCLKDFRILILRKGNKIIAGMPLPMSSKWGKTNISMPPLTQTLGVLLLPTRTSYEGRLSEEMEVMERLINAIPNFSWFSTNFHNSFTNWLPFYWTGYSQTTRYTYIIGDLTDLNKIILDFAHSKRNNITRAERMVSVHENLPAEQFYAHHRFTLEKQDKSIGYSYDFFKRIYNAALEKSAQKTWYALDTHDNIHAAIFVIYDNKSAYYLINSVDPEYRSSGATTLLVMNAIKYVSKYTKRFDFEGSMIRGVENSFRRFGAVQTPYFNISQDRRFLFIKTAHNKSIVYSEKVLRKMKLSSFPRRARAFFSGGKIT